MAHSFFRFNRSLVGYTVLDGDDVVERNLIMAWRGGCRIWGSNFRIVASLSESDWSMITQKKLLDSIQQTLNVFYSGKINDALPKGIVVLLHSKTIGMVEDVTAPKGCLIIF